MMRSLGPRALRPRSLVGLAQARSMQYAADPQHGARGSHGDYRAWRGTTVLCLQRGDQAVMIADGQVSMGDVVFKSNVRKVRRFDGKDGNEGNVVAGFAGGTADALTLFERLESRLEEFPGQLTRAATSLAKDWRSDKYLRRLEATMVVSDGKNAYLISGGGDVMSAEDSNGINVVGIGSGGFYATAAARAMTSVADKADLELEEIARTSMTVAADLCVYTNHNFVMETVDRSSETKEEEAAAAAAASADAEKEQEADAGDGSGASG